MVSSDQNGLHLEALYGWLTTNSRRQHATDIPDFDDDELESELKQENAPCGSINVPSKFKLILQSTFTGHQPYVIVNIKKLRCGITGSAMNLIVMTKPATFIINKLNKK